MNIVYELTPQDYLAFTLFHERHSPALRRRRIANLGFAAIVMLGLPALVFITSKKPLLQTAADIWPLLTGFVLSAVCVGPYAKWRTTYIFKRLLNEGNSAGYYGRCEMTLDTDGIRESKASGECTRKWSAVDKVVFTNNHVFVYLSGVEAFVIPRRALDDDAFCDFVTYIAQHSGVKVQQAFGARSRRRR